MHKKLLKNHTLNKRREPPFFTSALFGKLWIYNLTICVFYHIVFVVESVLMSNPLKCEVIIVHNHNPEECVNFKPLIKRDPIFTIKFITNHWCVTFISINGCLVNNLMTD